MLSGGDDDDDDDDDDNNWPILYRLQDITRYWPKISTTPDGLNKLE